MTEKWHHCNSKTYIFLKRDLSLKPLIKATLAFNINFKHEIPTRIKPNLNGGYTITEFNCVYSHSVTLTNNICIFLYFLLGQNKEKKKRYSKDIV